MEHVAAGDPQPWWNRVPQIAMYPFCTSGVIALGAMTVAAVLQKMGRFSAYGMIASLAGSGLIFAVVFLVIRHSARGSTEFPAVAEIEDPFDDVLVPGIKVTLLGLLLYAPAIYCFVNGAFGFAGVGTEMMMRGAKPPGAHERAGFGLTPGAFPGSGGEPIDFDEDEDEEIADEGMGLFDSPDERAEFTGRAAKAAAWLLAAAVAAALSSMVYPLCLIVLAMSGSLRMALFPMTWFVILRQVPLGYLGVLAALVLGSGASIAFAFPFRFVPVPFVPTLAGSVVRMYFALCGAHLLGWFVFQNRARLGIADEPDRREVSVSEVKAAAVAGAGPQYRPAAGMVRVGTAAPLAAEPGELRPGEVAGGPPVAPPWGDTTAAPGGEEIAGLHARFQSACASRDLAAISQSAPVLVDAYWQAGDAAGAEEVYRSLIAVTPETSLGPERQGRIAKELESSGDLQSAMTAWRTLALAHPDHPRAPTALWRCAEICAKLNRQDWVASACQAIIARYPMSEVASMAQARLRKLGT